MTFSLVLVESNTDYLLLLWELHLTPLNIKFKKGFTIWYLTHEQLFIPTQAQHVTLNYSYLGWIY